MNPQDQEPQALPELPEKRCLGWSGDRYDSYQIMGYDEEDLEDYAKAAIALATQEPQRAEPSDEVEILREALWVATEHNCLHFGENHNTVVQGRAALATRKDVSPPPEPAKAPNCRESDGRCGICGGDWSVCGCQGMLNRSAAPPSAPASEPAERAAFDAWWLNAVGGDLGIEWEWAAWKARSALATSAPAEPLSDDDIDSIAQQVQGTEPGVWDSLFSKEAIRSVVRAVLAKQGGGT